VNPFNQKMEPTVWVVHRLAPTYMHTVFCSPDREKCVAFIDEAHKWYDRVFMSDPVPLYEVRGGWILKQLDQPFVTNRLKRAWLALKGEL
jgi:hypothetical protein